MPKMCELCKIKLATVPDRNRMGKPIPRICSDCHAERLHDDLKKVRDNYIMRKKKDGR